MYIICLHTYQVKNVLQGIIVYNYLGGALSAMTTIMYTDIVEYKGGEPESTAFTINIYSDDTDMSSSFITCKVPSLLSILNTLPTFPVYDIKNKPCKQMKFINIL